ncbi:hypothetical protein Bca4012_037808 [Brassica carinata]
MAVYIRELTMLIRNDITGLNMALSDLQTLQNMEISDGSYSHDKFGHYTAVCDDLKTRLMGGVMIVRGDFGNSGYLNRLSMVFQIELRSQMLQIWHKGLPYEISNITVLELLDVHNNYITGDIPDQLGNLVKLEQLDLSRNSFSGNIPLSFGNFSYLNKLILNNNLLTGQIPKSIKNLQNLTLLNLSFNNFSGEFPQDLGQVTTLTINLNLSYIAFTGDIPKSFSAFTQLQSLDLSHNTLHGDIKVLDSLTSLASLNISFNNFSSPIPATPFFKPISVSSYLKNTILCHLIDGITCSLCRGQSKYPNMVALISVILASTSIPLLATWLLLLRNNYRYKPQKQTITTRLQHQQQ